jgi:hypothetical protein
MKEFLERVVMLAFPKMRGTDTMALISGSQVTLSRGSFFFGKLSIRRLLNATV